VRLLSAGSSLSPRGLDRTGAVGLEADPPAKQTGFLIEAPSPIAREIGLPVSPAASEGWGIIWVSPFVGRRGKG
jgi:hypothetical protein